jgi:polysaccharide pyruvyl transferase WcaK-like protein
MGDDLMQLRLSQIIGQETQNLTIYSDCQCAGIENGLDSDAYLHSDLIIIGGGGVISPDFWAFSGGRMDKLAGKNLVFFNVSVYESDLTNIEFSAKLANLKALVWYVRDSKSQTLLDAVGINSVLLPDVIFASQPEEESSDDSRLMLVYPNYYAFARNFELERNLETSVNYLSFSMTMAKYIDWMAEFGWNVKLIAAQTDRFVDDNIVSASIYSFVKNKNAVEWVKEPLLFTEHESIISKSKLVVSMRYHSSLMAVKHGVSCLDIVHHDKNRGLWEDVGFGDNVIELPLSIPVMIEATEALAHNHKGYLSTTRRYTRWAMENWELNLNHIKKYFNE